MTTQHRICRNCPVHHAENCETCFGFGLYEVGRIITAHQAMYGPLNGVAVMCPECRGTPTGIVPDEN